MKGNDVRPRAADAQLVAAVCRVVQSSSSCITQHIARRDVDGAQRSVDDDSSPVAAAQSAPWYCHTFPPLGPPRRSSRGEARGRHWSRPTFPRTRAVDTS